MWAAIDALNLVSSIQPAQDATLSAQLDVDDSAPAKVAIYISPTSPPTKTPTATPRPTRTLAPTSTPTKKPTVTLTRVPTSVPDYSPTPLSSNPARAPVSSTAIPTLFTISGETYGALSVFSAPTDRPAAQHADLNLALRGYSSINAPLGLVDYTGIADVSAPQLSGLFADDRSPNIKSV